MNIFEISTIFSLISILFSFIGGIFALINCEKLMEISWVISPILLIIAIALIIIGFVM